VILNQNILFQHLVNTRDSLASQLYDAYTNLTAGSRLVIFTSMFGQNKHESNTQPQPHTTNTHHPASKAHLSTFNGPEQIPTAVKRQESNQLYTQMTPKPQRKILLYGENHGRFLFPLVRDRDVGIPAAYQNIVIESVPFSSLSTTMTTGRQPAHSCNGAWCRPWRISTTCFLATPTLSPPLTIPSSATTSLEK
jgi:hypothetical protein